MAVTAKRERKRRRMGLKVTGLPVLGLPSERASARERAYSKLGGSPVSRIVWLVNFAQVPSIEGLSPAALLELDTEVSQFATGGEVKGPGSRPGSEAEIRMELSRLTRFAAEAINGFLTAEGYSFRPFEFGSMVRHVQRFGRKIVASSEGDRATHFVMEAARFIEREGNRITTCASVPCGRMFVKRKRALYCSARCSQRERIRRHRKKLTTQDRYLIRHTQYVKSLPKNRVVRPRGPRGEMK
jgi:hypothetical protein